MTSNRHFNPEDLKWKCFKCGQALVPGPALVDYLGNDIKAELPQCPTCHRVLISEELCQGKVAEVEAILENK